MQIVVRQTSGLGNQLFQYAAGRYLAKKHGAALRIAHELDKNLHKHGADRPVMLQKFSIRAPVGRANAVDRLILSKRRELAAAARLLCAASRIQVIREPADSLEVRRDFPIDEHARVVYIQGYWQADWIVQGVEAELRKEFALTHPLGSRSREVADRIDKQAHPVSIHLRRGDYLTVFGQSAVLPFSYYATAIRIISNRHPDSTFFVFSDDPHYARQQFGDNPKFTIVDHNDAHSAQEDLVLMSRCRHHIIANSTFSWWGAWLNARSDKQVIAPATWLGVKTAEATIASPSWTLVDV